MSRSSRLLLCCCIATALIAQGGAFGAETSPDGSGKNGSDEKKQEPPRSGTDSAASATEGSGTVKKEQNARSVDPPGPTPESGKTVAPKGEKNDPSLDREPRKNELQVVPNVKRESPSRSDPPAAAPTADATGGAPKKERSAKSDDAPGSPSEDKKQSLPKDGGKTDPSLQTPRVVGVPPGSPADKRTPPIATIFDQPGVLTPARTLVLEPSLQYLNSSSNRVALSGYTVIPSLTIGLIDVRNVNSNTYIAALATRYGITNRIEAEIRVPYVYRSDSTASQPANTPGENVPASVFVADGNGIGDVDFGIRYQVNQPQRTDGPYFITGLRVKTPTGVSPFDVKVDPNVKGPDGEPLQTELPTGSGFWSLQPSLTALFTSDPAAFFGSMSYMWNIERSYGGASYNPGDTFEFNFGIGVALNEKTSISLGYDHTVLGKTRRNGADLPGTMVTQVGTLLLGGSYRLDDKTSLNLSLGIGATPAASNVQLTLRVPVSIFFGK